jgi:S-(hydroxymethyl)glutathione dehydrogenase/alcohol dehydrogenase
MKTEAAVLWEVGGKWVVEELDLDPPSEREILVELVGSGLCHTDDHSVTGDVPLYLPTVGGHEGAGIVREVGGDVTRFREGDHVVLTVVPSCGACRWCAAGLGNLCDRGAWALAGHAPDGTFRHHLNGQDIGSFCQLGAFSRFVVTNEIQAVKIDDDVPLHLAALVGCGVTTGFGAAVRAGKVEPGDTVVVVGVGGVGMNAVQGARIAGAARIVAIDPVAFKREQALQFGATHTVASIEEAGELVSSLTRGVGADKAIICVGVVRGEMIAPVMSLVSKSGRVVVTGVSPMYDDQVTLSLFDLAMMQKELVGHIFGQARAIADFPRIFELYRSGSLKLEELVTRTYSLDEINRGWEDMWEGRNIRGLIRFD